DHGPDGDDRLGGLRQHLCVRLGARGEGAFGEARAPAVARERRLPDRRRRVARRLAAMSPLRLLAALGLALLVAACAHQPPPTGGAPLPGFVLGLLHGYISLFSLIASLFFPVRIYEFPNNGFFYDLG